MTPAAAGALRQVAEPGERNPARVPDVRMIALCVGGTVTGFFGIVLLFPWWLTIVALLEVIAGAAILATSD